jgi:hypothetical protein
MIDVLHHARELILSSVNWYVSGWSNPNGNLMVSPRLARLGVMNRSWTAILNETEAANLGKYNVRAVLSQPLGGFSLL